MNTLKEIAQTKSGKAFVAVWLVTVLCAIAISLAGYADRGFAGTVAFSVIVAGILANVCTIISYWAGTKSILVARLTWLSLSLLALLSVLALLNAGKSDADIVLAYAVLVLSFPLGFVIGPLVGTALAWDGVGSIAIYWAVGIVTGYLQWFVILPRLISAIRTKEQ